MHSNQGHSNRGQSNRGQSNRGKLIEQASLGDHQAFSQLLRTHDEQMRALAFRTLGSQQAMDDALQVAYLNAFRHIASYTGDGPFAAWLRRIVVNCCRDVQRKQERLKEVSLDQLTDGGHEISAPERFEDGLAEGDEMQRSLQSLSPDQRLALILVNGQGLSYSEAAKMCNVAEGTIGSRLNRAHEILRAEFEQPPTSQSRPSSQSPSPYEPTPHGESLQQRLPQADSQEHS